MAAASLSVMPSTSEQCLSSKVRTPSAKPAGSCGTATFRLRVLTFTPCTGRSTGVPACDVRRRRPQCQPPPRAQRSRRIRAGRRTRCVQHMVSGFVRARTRHSRDWRGERTASVGFSSFFEAVVCACTGTLHGHSAYQVLLVALLRQCCQRSGSLRGEVKAASVRHAVRCQAARRTSYKPRVPRRPKFRERLRRVCGVP